MAAWWKLRMESGIWHTYVQGRCLEEGGVLWAAPQLTQCLWPRESVRDDFDTPVLPLKYQSLRVPLNDQMLSLTVRPGYVRLYGRESLGSRFCQSLIARRRSDWQNRKRPTMAGLPRAADDAAGDIFL